jgi:acyl transferase domain-containing protein
VFVFSGTGGQWWGMGRELMDREAVFRAAIEEFDERWGALTGWSILADWRAPESESRIGRHTSCSTVAQVAMQMALARLWASWGVVPHSVVGHSLGELPAAHCAGVLELADLVALTKARCDWQETVDGLGAMAAVGLSESETRKALARHAPELDLAAINAPSATTVSGAAAAIDRLCDALEREGVLRRHRRHRLLLRRNPLRRASRPGGRVPS